MQRSTKTKKPLEDLLGNKRFIIPRQFANDTLPETGEPCLKITINSFATYVPVEKPTPIPYEVFCVLKDAKIVSANQTFEIGRDFDPLRYD